ncbi:MAG: cobalamin-dependent protein [Planctomycetes bacterium]|nr:cobalamin-dependent protein [Planctomycetota bacterium]
MESKGPLAAAIIRSARRAHAAGVTLRMQERHPELMGCFGRNGFGDLTAHNEALLDYLSATLEVGRPVLFFDHVGWLLGACEARGVPLEGLREGIVCLRQELLEELPEAAAQSAVACLDGALAHFDTLCEHDSDPQPNVNPQSALARLYLLAVLEGRRRDAIELATDAVAGGLSITDLYAHVLTATQVEVGRLWHAGELHVAEEHMCSRITEQVMAIVSAQMPRAPRNGLRVLTTSASGDLHDIGLRMIADHFEMAGWDAVSLGASTPAEDFARAAHEFEPHLLAISAKLVLHLRSTIDMIAAVRVVDGDKRTPILVGGSPFVLVPDLWKIVGADGMANGGLEAVATGRRLVTDRTEPEQFFPDSPA